MNGLATLTVLHWSGEFPLPGHFVKSDRGRTAFYVIEVKRAPPGKKYVAKFICERTPVRRLHPQAIVHPWVWSKR